MRRPSPSRVAAFYLSPGHMSIRVADAFLDAIEGKTFRNPDTGNQVLFNSLPEGEKKKIRSDWSESQKEEGGHGDKHDAPKQSFKDKLKSLGQKASDFLKNAPEKAKKFIEDPEFRKETLASASESLKKAPEKYAKNLVEAAEHEVKEFKEAGEGIRAVLKGGEMSDHQKKAFKTVATHLAIGIAAAALTSSGPLAAAGAFSKGMAKNIALKAAKKGLENLHLLEELSHVGHGIHHLLHLAGDEKGDSEEVNVNDVLGKYISALVAKEIESVTDDDVTDSLKGLDSDKK